MKQCRRMEISYVPEPQIDKIYVCRLMPQSKANNKKKARKIPEWSFKYELRFIKKRLNNVLFILSCFQHVVSFSYFMIIFLSQYRKILRICNEVLKFSIMKISRK